MSLNILFLLLIFMLLYLYNLQYNKYKNKEFIKLNKNNNNNKNNKGISNNQCCKITIRNNEDKFYYDFQKSNNCKKENNLSQLGVVEYFFHNKNNWDNKYCDKNFKINFDNKKTNTIGSCRFNNQNCVDFITPKMCKKMNKTNNFIFSEKPCKEKICLPPDLSQNI